MQHPFVIKHFSHNIIKKIYFSKWHNISLRMLRREYCENERQGEWRSPSHKESKDHSPIRRMKITVLQEGWRSPSWESYSDLTFVFCLTKSSPLNFLNFHAMCLIGLHATFFFYQILLLNPIFSFIFSWSILKFLCNNVFNPLSLASCLVFWTPRDYQRQETILLLLNPPNITLFYFNSLHCFRLTVGQTLHGFLCMFLHFILMTPKLVLLVLQNLGYGFLRHQKDSLFRLCSLYLA